MSRIALCALFASTCLAVQDPPPTPEAPPTADVARGDLELSVDAQGWLEAEGGFEARLKLRAYSGPFEVKSFAEDGSAVKSGQVILQLDDEELKRQIDAAEGEASVAEASRKQAGQAASLDQRTERLDRAGLEASLADAEKQLADWKSVGLEEAKLRAQMSLDSARHSVEDQEEELAQLKKMYESEDLTNATAEIVVKRAERSLERTKKYYEIEKHDYEQALAIHIPAQERQVVRAVEDAKIALERHRAQAALQEVQTAANLRSAGAQAEAAARKLADLKADVEALTVRAPFDGIVLHGQFAMGAWQGNHKGAIRAGEDVGPGQVLMTVFRPGRLRAVLPLAEGQRFLTKVGAVARVSPGALPEAAGEATIRSISATRQDNGPAPGYPAVLELAKVDERLMPGMQVTVHVNVEPLKGVLLVPVAAVQGGHVTVVAGDKQVRRNVVVGRSDGKQVEVLSGLKEGEKVLLGGGE